jgi:hypothetical protein
MYSTSRSSNFASSITKCHRVCFGKPHLDMQLELRKLPPSRNACLDGEMTDSADRNKVTRISQQRPTFTVASKQSTSQRERI